MNSHCNELLPESVVKNIPRDEESSLSEVLQSIDEIEKIESFNNEKALTLCLRRISQHLSLKYHLQVNLVH